MQQKCGNGVGNILSRRHSLLRHSRAMITRDVALPEKRASVQPLIPSHCFPRIKQLVEDFASQIAKTLTARHNFVNSHFFRV